MASKIILKKSSVAAKAPVAADLEFGELALNYTDSKLYFKKADGTTIDAFSSSTAAGTVTSVGITPGTGISVSGSPITTSGNITVTNSAPNVTTDISTTHNATTVVVNSSDGADGTINAATTSLAGVMTGADKTKLDGIAAGAQVNVATNLGYTAATRVLTSSTGTSVTLPQVTTSVDGLMIAADKTKLNGIATGATANTGTVTSVGGTGTVSGLSLSGTVTTSGNLTLGGTLAVTPSNFASQTANTVLAAPDGTNGVPTFRSLTLTDAPDAWVKKSVQCATTTALTINTAQTTIDGVTLTSTSRVLVKDQAAPAQNGIYTALTTTTWVRTTDADTSSKIAGAVVNVDGGTVNGGLRFDADFKSTDTLGTTAMNWHRIVDTAFAITSGSTLSDAYVRYSGTTDTNGQFNGGTTTPTGTARLNYSGYFYPTFINLLGSSDTSTASTHYFVETGSDGFVRPKTLANVRTEVVTSAAVVAGLGFTPYNATNPSGYTSNTGTVTSVGGTGTVSGLTLSGTVTTSGNLTLGGTLAVTASNFASQTANTFLSAPNGVAGVPTFRTIVAADVPTLNQNTTGTASNVTGTVAIANGGTGATTAATALTNLGAYPATNPNGYTSNTGTVTGVTGTAPIVSSGGTAPAISISAATTSAAGSMSAADKTKLDGIATGATANTGTVTSVATSGTVSGLTLTGGTITTSGTITLAGTLAVTPSNFASQTANTVLAAPNGSAGTPTFRALAAADIPALTLEKLPDAWVKRAVRVATTANITLSGTQTIDGIVVVAGDRVLVKDQTTASQNGIYIVSATAWSRSLDADAATDLGAAQVAVDSGTTNGGYTFDTDFKTTDTVGTTAMNWSRVLDVAYLSTVGNNFATLANPSAITFPRINANNTVSALDAATFRTAIGAGTSSTTGTVTSVAVSGGTTGLTTSGGPITTSGTITLAGTLAIANGGTGNTTGTATNATNVAVTTSATASAFKVPFANTTANTTGNYGLLQDSESTFTYNPSTNTLIVGTVSGALSGNATTSTTATTATNVSITDDTASTATHYIMMGDATSGTDGVKISTTKVSFQPSTGNLTIAGNLAANSDERLKKDWLSLPHTFLEDLSKVKSGTYTRVDNGERQAGASAQDWQKLLPEVVVKAATEEGTLALAYGNAALVSAIELAKKVVSLEERLAKLEKLIQ